MDSVNSLDGGVAYTAEDVRARSKHRWMIGGKDARPYLKKGYRVNLSWAQIARSVFRVHNETVNVWSHFLGCLVFMGLLGYVALGLLPN